MLSSRLVQTAAICDGKSITILKDHKVDWQTGVSLLLLWHASIQQCVGLLSREPEAYLLLLDVNSFVYSVWRAACAAIIDSKFQKEDLRENTFMLRFYYSF
jgi:hypothetical protein